MTLRGGAAGRGWNPGDRPLHVRRMNDHVLRELAGDVLRPTHGAVELLDVRGEWLRGGISAGRVLTVIASFRDRAGRRREATCVVKELEGPASREAAIHVGLALEGVRAIPRLHAVVRERARTLIVMERVVGDQRWPWRDPTRAELVLRLAAGLHATSLTVDAPWDYDAELERMAASTMEAVQAHGESPVVDAASARAVRRLVEDLPRVRRALVTRGPFPPAVIHGDLHPGNVILAKGREGPRPVLLDWGRARRGSPLEDVASWLQSLGCWEPEVRRRHDTLLLAYLRERGHAGPIPAQVRELLWLAGGCNALAGALRHHLLVATAPAPHARHRATALRAARDWLRIIRRAAAVWSASPTPRGGSDRRTPRHDPGLDPRSTGRRRRWPADTRSSAHSSPH